MKKVARRIILAILALDILAVTGCSKMQQGRADTFDPACDYQYQYYNTDVNLGLNKAAASIIWQEVICTSMILKLERTLLSAIRQTACTIRKLTKQDLNLVMHFIHL